MVEPHFFPFMLLLTKSSMEGQVQSIHTSGTALHPRANPRTIHKFRAKKNDTRYILVCMCIVHDYW